MLLIEMYIGTVVKHVPFNISIMVDDRSLTGKCNRTRGHPIVFCKLNVYLIFKMFMTRLQKGI